MLAIRSQILEHYINAINTQVNEMELMQYSIIIYCFIALCKDIYV
jgi:hypothetical protein